MVKKFRHERGLTQHQAADALHMDRSTYAYYELVRTRMNIDLLIGLARLYQVKLGELFGESACRPRRPRRHCNRFFLIDQR